MTSRTLREAGTMAILPPVSVPACAGPDADGQGADDATTQQTPALVNSTAPASPGSRGASGASEVYVFSDINYWGSRRGLSPGCYPTPELTGLPNDSIRSIVVGGAVRLRTFRDATSGGGFKTWSFGSGSPPGDWNSSMSSTRVEMGARLADCRDLQPGEIGLFRDRDLKGDCPTQAPWASPTTASRRSGRSAGLRSRNEVGFTFLLDCYCVLHSLAAEPATQQALN